MIAVRCTLYFVVITFLWMFVLARNDVDVPCVFMESCILPCSFSGGAELVIHWIEMTGNAPVHTYYHSEDQLTHQDSRFKGRTSLFKDQISKQNASLQLIRVKVQDQGRYKCHTSTITGDKDSFINLKVDAPVGEVSIQQEENRITCSSEGIYPEPELTWSTSPPSNETLKNTTTVQQTEQKLFNINSSLILSDMVFDLDYSCTISTVRNKRRATLRQLALIIGADTKTTVPCTTSNTPLTGLIWRYNNSEIILKQTGSGVSHTVSEEWKQQVKDVSESGSLTLQDLTSDHEGIYTCELRNAEGTYITNSFLRIEKSQASGNSAIVGGIIGVVLFIIVVVGLVVYCTKTKSSCAIGEASTQRPEEMKRQQPPNQQSVHLLL